MRRTIVLCIFFVVLSSFFIQCIEKDRTFKKLEKERLLLEKTLVAKQRELRHLERQFEKSTTVEARENLAREKLNMVKKGEIRYILKY